MTRGARCYLKVLRLLKDSHKSRPALKADRHAVTLVFRNSKKNFYLRHTEVEVINSLPEFGKKHFVANLIAVRITRLFKQK